MEGRMAEYHESTEANVWLITEAGHFLLEE